MKKFVMMLMIVGLAGAGFVLAPASAEEGCLSDAVAETSELGEACGGIDAENGTGYGYIDGADGNEDPLDGYIVAEHGQNDYEGDGTLCASAHGDPQQDEPDNNTNDDPDCDDEIPEGSLNYFTQ